MKKIIFFMVIVFFGVFFINYNDDVPVYEEEEKQDVKAVFISYIDYASLRNKEVEEQKNIINEMINNVSYFGLNTIILQVRANADALYDSSYYPNAIEILNDDDGNIKLDILEYFIEQANKKNIDIYAWVNPYRVSTTNDVESINKTAIYYKWLNTNKIEVTEDGIYLNPAEEEVLELILNGVGEIVKKYNVKAILYDDYFYPNKEIDLENYNNYKGELSLEEYRIENINNLLKQTCERIKEINKNVMFGISPSGNIENNLKNEFLDIEGVLREKYLDFIMPQLYYGFRNETKPYVDTLKTWSDLNINNIDLHVALSLYKSGTLDVFAGSGQNEWLEQTDIIKRQILISKNIPNYKGFAIFRYQYLFEIFDNENLTKEIEALRTIMTN